MSTKNTDLDRFLRVDKGLRELVPHLHGWLNDEGQVRRLLIKAQDDGTFLAVAAGYDSDGAPIVCFGVGYGAVGAIYGIDRTIQGGRWRRDKYAGGSEK